MRKFTDSLGEKPNPLSQEDKLQIAKTAYLRMYLNTGIAKLVGNPRRIAPLTKEENITSTIVEDQNCPSP